MPKVKMLQNYSSLEERGRFDPILIESMQIRPPYVEPGPSLDPLLNNPLAPPLVSYDIFDMSLHRGSCCEICVRGGRTSSSSSTEEDKRD